MQFGRLVRKVGPRSGPTSSTVWSARFASRRSEGGRNRWTTAAFALVLAIGVASTAVRSRLRPVRKGAGGGQAPAGAQGRGSWRWCTLHTRSRSQGPEGRALQLDVAPGHAEGHRRTRHGRDARVSGQGRHDSGRRPAVHAVEVPCEHQLPDVQSADSVHLHAAEQADVLEHRGGQLAVRVERRHARRGDRWNEGQGRGDAGGRAGAADSHLGQSAGRGQGRAGRDHGHLEAGRQPGHGDRRRRDEGRQHVRVVGCRGQAGRDLPDSGRCRARPAPPRSMRST